MPGDETRAPESVLFIRRDNIGDLVCTTPAIRAVRLKYPKTKISVLVNSYNADVVRTSPDINEVFIYEKFKHNREKGRVKVLLGNMGLMGHIKWLGFKAVVACSYSYSARLAKLVRQAGGGRAVSIGFVPTDGSVVRHPYTHAIAEPGEPIHEVSAMMRLVAPLGVDYTASPPPLVLVPGPAEVERARESLGRAGLGGGERPVAFHISSRRERNRWPVEGFARLGDEIQARTRRRVLVLWSPGSEDNAMHPGDDEAAARLISSMKTPPLSYRTESLGDLIAALSLAGPVVCLDGGAMHIAAALGRPVLTIWGSTEPRRWAPWGVRHVILQKEDGLAESVTPDEAFAAFEELCGAGRDAEAGE